MCASAAMVGSPYINWYSSNPFWNYRPFAKRWYVWFLLLVANFCSYNTSEVCSGLEIITDFLFCNSLIISSPFIVLIWCNSLSNIVLIWSAHNVLLYSKIWLPRALHSPLCLGLSPYYLYAISYIHLPRPPWPPWPLQIHNHASFPTNIIFNTLVLFCRVLSCIFQFWCWFRFHPFFLLYFYDLLLRGWSIIWFQVPYLFCYLFEHVIPVSVLVLIYVYGDCLYSNQKIYIDPFEENNLINVYRSIHFYFICWTWLYKLYQYIYELSFLISIKKLISFNSLNLVWNFIDWFAELNFLSSI